jgi:catechol 2,3-dioxygenase-like lactoylglutathione lyase family enzyme
LHDAKVVPRSVVDVQIETGFLDLEGRGAIHVGDGDQHDLKLPIHGAPPLTALAATIAGPSDSKEVQMAEFPAPSEGIVLTHFIVSDDVGRSRRFYTDVLGGEVVLEGEPTIVALANGWIIINVGGGPTEDKPSVTLETPPDPDRVSSFLNIRVADIGAVYADWSARGAEFLTPPIDRGREIRCYLRDPDGHLIEVGQSTGVLRGETS